MIRYAISIFAFILWLLISPAGVFAQSTGGKATLSLDPANGTFNKGCNFSLNINLDTGGAQTDGTDAILIYDISRFSALSITNGTIYPDYPGNNIDLQAGKITISGLASVNTPFAGNGVFAKVNFKVNDAAPTGAAQITFDFDPNNKAKTTDSNVVERDTVVDLLNSVVNGSYIIGTGPCNAIQSPSPSPSRLPLPTVQPRGGPGSTSSSTPSATITPSPTEQTILPSAGSEQFTFTVAIFGGALTILGILGLALL